MASKAVIAVGLDAGSAVTRCLICSVEDGRIRYRGHGSVDSAGWNRSRIADPEAVSACIQSAVQQAEAEAGVAVETLVSGIAGSGIEAGQNRGIYESMRPRPVTQDDVEYAVARAARVNLAEGRCLLQVMPQDFTLDGRAGYRNPRGSTCSRLEANAYILTASVQDHDCLIYAIHHAHYGVEETLFEPFAAAYAAIVAEERSRGVALIDIGQHSTDIVVYDGEAVRLAKSLPICADHFTRDVAYGLKISYSDAEAIKIEYGCAMLGLTADNSVIELPSPDPRRPRECSRVLLNDILEARAEQLFDFLRTDLEAIGMDHRSLLEGVVLTGGGSLLLGMPDMAERVLNCQARKGLPEGILDLPDELASPLWVTAAGLSMYSARLKMKKEFKPKSQGLAGLILR